MKRKLEEEKGEEKGEEKIVLETLGARQVVEPEIPKQKSIGTPSWRTLKRTIESHSVDLQRFRSLFSPTILKNLDENHIESLFPVQVSVIQQLLRY